MPSRVPTLKPVRYGKPKPPPLAEHNKVGNTQFSASKRWRACRAAYLVGDPLCHDCKADGRVEPAVHVHHKVKRADDPSRETWFDHANLMGLCVSCHNARTARGE